MHDEKPDTVEDKVLKLEADILGLKTMVDPNYIKKEIAEAVGELGPQLAAQLGKEVMQQLRGESGGGDKNPKLGPEGSEHLSLANVDSNINKSLLEYKIKQLDVTFQERLQNMDPVSKGLLLIREGPRLGSYLKALREGFEGLDIKGGAKSDPADQFMDFIGEGGFIDKILKGVYGFFSRMQQDVASGMKTYTETTRKLPAGIDKAEIEKMVDRKVGERMGKTKPTRGSSLGGRKREA